MPARDRERDEYFMEAALREARESMLYGEVPVGAVIVRDDEIIASSGNFRERTKDATAHAEICAIRAANASLGGWRLVGCELFVTLEPCVMCAGAIINSRLPAVIYGASDLRFGALGSLCDIRSLGLNHRPEVVGGVLAKESRALLREFFGSRR